MTNEIEDIEAAIEILKEDLKSSAYYAWMKKGNAYKLAIAALNKQISKRPVIKPWSPALCPLCGMELSENSKICECGQKLSWEVKDK